MVYSYVHSMDCNTRFYSLAQSRGTNGVGMHQNHILSKCIGVLARTFWPEWMKNHIFPWKRSKTENLIALLSTLSSVAKMLQHCGSSPMSVPNFNLIPARNRYQCKVQCYLKQDAGRQTFQFLHSWINISAEDCLHKQQHHKRTFLRITIA